MFPSAPRCVAAAASSSSARNSSISASAAAIASAYKADVTGVNDTTQPLSQRLGYHSAHGISLPYLSLPPGCHMAGRQSTPGLVVATVIGHSHSYSQACSYPSMARSVRS
eukprot:1194547-Prorocentrum_minimum.AAC.1